MLLEAHARADKTEWVGNGGHLVDGPFKGHVGQVNSVAFSPDGVSIVSSSSDRTILVWSVLPLLIHAPADLKDWLIDKESMITTR